MKNILIALFSLVIVYSAHAKLAFNTSEIAATINKSVKYKQGVGSTVNASMLLEENDKVVIPKKIEVHEAGIAPINTILMVVIVFLILGAFVYLWRNKRLGSISKKSYTAI
ncbi:MAG: hypothetical protein J0M08_13360 [Bacteroidetes bacterium]|nr:hypothetical protein [Bacteroidota bacterium]